jgi:hypothetical protein
MTQQLKGGIKMKKILFILMVLTLSFSLASCSFTTANISDLSMATEVDQDNLPISIASTFSTSTPVIYATGKLNNAPDGTKLTAEWYYLDQNPAYLITGTELNIENVNTNFSFYLSIPDNGWPQGNYSVKFYIDGEEASSIDFQVE